MTPRPKNTLAGAKWPLGLFQVEHSSSAEWNQESIKISCCRAKKVFLESSHRIYIPQISTSFITFHPRQLYSWAHIFHPGTIPPCHPPEWQQELSRKVAGRAACPHVWGMWCWECLARQSLQDGIFMSLYGEMAAIPPGWGTLSRDVADYTLPSCIKELCIQL